MKKTMLMLVAAMGVLLSGCDVEESQLVAGANMSGNLAMLTWFSVDDPDADVKATLKDVVSCVVTASVQVAEGKTYLDSLLPQVQQIANKQEKLNDYQKTLVSAGAMVVLNGIDTFMATNEKVKGNAELVSKVVASFGKGCLSVLDLSNDSPAVKNAKNVYMTRQIRFRSVKAPVATK